MGLTRPQLRQLQPLKGIDLPLARDQPGWERRGLKTAGTQPAGKYIAGGMSGQLQPGPELYLASQRYT